jgi:hypothetical protein
MQACDAEGRRATALKLNRWSQESQHLFVNRFLKSIKQADGATDVLGLTFLASTPCPTGQANVTVVS